ncbi:MAG: TonB-dependent receptor plug domain-containing protein, partial [Vicinamibacterales bacterium]
MPIRHVFVALVAVLGLVHQAGAQPSASAGTIRGSVADPSGAVLVRASIDLLSGAGTSRATLSDGDGNYAFDGVPPGRYRVIASYPGLAPLIKEDVDVAGGQVLDLPLALDVGRTESVVMVTASTRPQEVRDVQASAQVVTSEDLRAYAGNSVTEGLKLAAGVDARSSGANSSISIRGFTASGGSSVLVLADGLRRTGKYGSTNLNLFELEDVDRVEVIRGPMSALYGADATGGVVNV